MAHPDRRLPLRQSRILDQASLRRQGRSARAMPSTLADNGIPMRRRASVAEIADVVRMLAGPEGGYITGQTIMIDGGFTAK